MINNISNANSPNFNGTFKMYFNKKCSPELRKSFEKSFLPYKYRHTFDGKYDYYICPQSSDYNVANFIRENKKNFKIFSYFPHAKKLNEATSPDAVRFNTVLGMICFVGNERVTKGIAQIRDLKISETILDKLNLKANELNMSYNKKSGVIKYTNNYGLELIISPQTRDGHTLVFYKPKNGHGNTILRKYNTDIKLVDDKYNNPDKYRMFFDELSQAVKYYKSLLN